MSKANNMEVCTMSATKEQIYKFEDIEDALENQHAELVKWRGDALRELRACLGQDDQRPKRPAGAGVILKTFRRADGKPN